MEPLRVSYEVDKNIVRVPCGIASRSLKAARADIKRQGSAVTGARGAMIPHWQGAALAVFSGGSKSLVWVKLFLGPLNMTGWACLRGVSGLKIEPKINAFRYLVGMVGLCVDLVVRCVLVFIY